MANCQHPNHEGATLIDQELFPMDPERQDRYAPWCMACLEAEQGTESAKMDEVKPGGELYGRAAKTGEPAHAVSADSDERAYVGDDDGEASNTP